MSLLELGERPPRVTRRGLLIGAAAAGGLAVGWALWPRAVVPNLVAADGETVMNAWLKIGRDGRVTVVVPALEEGQGIYTTLPQIVADELGADWRTIAVEPAPISQAYVNPVFGAESGLGAMQASGFSAELRGLGPVAREAAAMARALLCMAAADRWDADWRECDVDLGFVTLGPQKLRFGELAEEAARFDPPDEGAFRQDGDNRLIRRGVSRLDAPSKIDGSANFAADIRLPDMVFAAIRQGPPGKATLIGADKTAADRIPGVISVVEHENWIAAAASNWWAANRALDAMRPRFRSGNVLVSTADIDRAFTVAFEGEGERIAEAGDAEAALTGGAVVRAEYAVGLLPHAALEPMAVTAWLNEDMLQLWLPTPWPVAAREAAARAIGLSPSSVTVHVTFAGGSFGRNFETDIAAQAAVLALKLGRPVQLMRSRAEEMLQDRYAPPARARMAGRVNGGRIEVWQARMATADGWAETVARALDGETPRSAPAFAGGVPPYTVPAFVIDRHPVDVGLPIGQLRGGGDIATVFATEAFVDELAAAAKADPFSFRMGLLGGNSRLAFCLSRTTSRGGWQGGGQGTGQGLALARLRGSHVAVMAEAGLAENGRVRVGKLTCVADIGRVLNPDIARQQIEGGLLFGMAMATGAAIGVKRGLPGPLRYGALGLPRLADMPEISVELVESREEPGGVEEIAVPAVGPAIANALFASTGRRFRTLPLAMART